MNAVDIPRRAEEVVERAFGSQWRDDARLVNLFAWIINALDAVRDGERAKTTKVLSEAEIELNNLRAVRAAAHRVISAYDGTDDLYAAVHELRNVMGIKVVQDADEVMEGDAG